MHRRLRRRHWHAGRHALSCRPQLERSRENLRLPIRLGCVQFGLTVKRRRCGKCCAASGWIHHFRLRQLRSEDFAAMDEIVVASGPGSNGIYQSSKLRCVDDVSFDGACP
jgi:hypothetical protein